MERQLRLLMRQRQLAKQQRDYASADALRARILAFGVDLFDRPAGVTACSGGPLAAVLSVDPADPATWAEGSPEPADPSPAGSQPLPQAP